MNKQVLRGAEAARQARSDRTPCAEEAVNHLIDLMICAVERRPPSISDFGDTASANWPDVQHSPGVEDNSATAATRLAIVHPFDRVGRAGLHR